MKVVPVLGLDGFESDGQAIMLKLYEYFRSSDHSQSNTFMGGVSSMKFVVAESDAADTLRRLLTEELTTMYTPYFTGLVLDILVKDLDNGMSAAIDISGIDQFGKTCTMSSSVQTQNNNIINYDTQQENYYVQG